MNCPFYIHKGTRPPIQVIYGQHGEPVELVCEQAGGILGCGFWIKRATVPAEMWERWLRFVTEPEMVYHDSGAGREQYG